MSPRKASTWTTIYCDESSQGERFLGWGGLWIPAGSEDALRKAIRAARVAAGWPAEHSELKWNKAGGRKAAPVYQGVVDAFFATECSFNCLLVDRYNPGGRLSGDEELDHYKALYWLISKRVQPHMRYRVVLDERTDRQADRLPTLRDVLNAAARRDHGYSHPECFAEVRPGNSHGEQLLQLADVLLGAVCFHMNKRHRRVQTSQGKCDLAAYVADRTGFVGGELTPTTARVGRFNVWRWSASM